MGYIYRFRRCADHSIEALSNLTIEGSLYETMDDKNEVLLKVDVNKLVNMFPLDYCLINETAKIIRKHILSNYYIACFTKHNQIDDFDMWETYAGKDGFCLVYDETDIYNAIKSSMIQNNHLYHLFREVDYGHEATDITIFVENYLKLVGDNFESEEAHRYAARNIAETFNANVSKKIINSMFHKIGIFPEKEEKRIVTRKNNSGKPFDSNMLMAKVKPSLVICSNEMPTDKMLIIKEIAKQNGITFRIHKLNVG